MNEEVLAHWGAVASKTSKKLRSSGRSVPEKELLVLVHLKVTEVRHKCRSWDNYWLGSLNWVGWKERK